MLAHRNRVDAAIPLDAAAVAVGPGGALVEVSAADALVPGSRVLAGMPDSVDLAREQAAWLAAGTVPRVSGLDSDMVAVALLDLHVLEPAVRRAGRRLEPTLALRVAARLRAGRRRRSLVPGTSPTPNASSTSCSEVQPESGLFQARYLPDGSGVPDDRGVELDGLGWALWATAQVAAELAERDRTAFVQRHRMLLDRSTEAALNRSTTDRLCLPPSSPTIGRSRRSG